MEGLALTSARADSNPREDLVFLLGKLSLGLSMLYASLVFSKGSRRLRCFLQLSLIVNTTTLGFTDASLQPSYTDYSICSYVKMESFPRSPHENDCCALFKMKINQGRKTAGQMTRETERCQGEFLWKCSLNSISMKRQLTRRCRLRLHEREWDAPHPESVKVYKLFTYFKFRQQRGHI